MMYQQLPFYFAVLCLLSYATHSLPTKRCVGKAANIMFVLDSSSSIWIVDYKKQLVFAQNLVDNFDIGADNSHVSVGAITFSDRAHLEFSLDQYTNDQQLKKAIANIPYRTGQTNTAEALQLLKSELKPKLKSSLSPFIAIVITDGKSRDSNATTAEAKLLHQLGIHVYAIGVGRNYDLVELKAIASDPVNNVYEVTSYSALQNIAKSFGVKTCEDITTPPITVDITTVTTKQHFTTTPATTTTTKMTTSAVRASTATTKMTTSAATASTATTKMVTSAVTASTTEFLSTKPFPLPTTTKKPIANIVRYQLSDSPQRDESSSVTYGYDLFSMGAYRANMITQFINTMLPYTGYGNFRVVSFAHCPVTFNVPMTSLTGKPNSETRNSINIAAPGLANVIREIRKGNEAKYSTITSKKNAAVLFVDPSVTAITPEVLEESEKLKKQGSKVFLVNVGGSVWPQPQLLHSISSQPYNRYTYNVPTYNQLLYRAHNTPFKFRAMCNSYRNRY